MAEIFIIERFRKRDLLVLERVDRAVLGIEKRAAVTDFAERLSDDPRHAERRRYRVAGVVDCALLVEMERGEVEVWVAEDRPRQRHVGPPAKLRSEQRDGLRVRAAVK